MAIKLKHRITWPIVFLTTHLLLVFQLQCCVKGHEFPDEDEPVDQNEIDHIGPGKSENVVEPGQDYKYICDFSINRRLRCLEFGPQCSIKIEWNFPEQLIDMVKQGLIAENGRYQILSMPETVKTPDETHYQSILLIKDIGYAHRGQYSCNLKMTNRELGKMSMLSKTVTIRVRGDGDRDTSCIYNDHCSSLNCTDFSCICNVEAPIESFGDCVQAPNIGERCRGHTDCQRRVKGSRCICPKEVPEEECGEAQTCQCPEDEVSVNLGLNHFRCMKKVKLEDSCRRSVQCEAVDPNSYCDWSGICSCKKDKNCGDLAFTNCVANSNCSHGRYCDDGRCKVLKSLRSSCRFDEQCQEKAQCSRTLKICECRPGFKESSNMQCIPEAYCEGPGDCKNGYCDINQCKKGVPLGVICQNLQQCKAFDENSVCDKKDEIRVCSCVEQLGYKQSRVARKCIPENHCLGPQDCDGNAQCQFGECVDPKMLGEECKTSAECLLSTNYSVCLTDRDTRCRCLNGRIKTDTRLDCRKDRPCQKNNECLSHQKCINGLCVCEDQYYQYFDGLCYKRLPRKSKENELKRFWYDHAVLIIVLMMTTAVGTFFCILGCCMYKQYRNQRKRLTEVPVQGFSYVPAAHLPRPPPTISARY